MYKIVNIIVGLIYSPMVQMCRNTILIGLWWVHPGFLFLGLHLPDLCPPYWGSPLSDQGFVRWNVHFWKFCSCSSSMNLFSGSKPQDPDWNFQVETYQISHFQWKNFHFSPRSIDSVSSWSLGYDFYDVSFPILGDHFNLYRNLNDFHIYHTIISIVLVFLDINDR